ncbi:hypothetical protein HAX54_050535 [Datura stramonium]|uniref:Secreted protein n=1 Tax=Datura stramonium TaxID=4076 RepID=A0ABS8WNK9_DATST|nr:hypothetical protein [Datura stramonium]
MKHRWWLLMGASSRCSIVSLADSAYPSPYGIEMTTSCQSTGSDDLIPVRREVYGNGRIFDITHRLTPDMPSWGLETSLDSSCG